MIDRIDVSSPKNRQICCISDKGRWCFSCKTKKELVELINKTDDEQLHMQWYITQNPVKKGLTTAAKKEDIVKWEVITLDFDTVRPPHCSATLEERKNSEIVCDRVREFLIEKGIYTSKFCSGNGWHLSVKVDFAAGEKEDEAVKTFLTYLDFLFSNQDAEIDLAMANRAQLTKLYGTQTRKGEKTEERGWWWSYNVADSKEMKEKRGKCDFNNKNPLKLNDLIKINKELEVKKGEYMSTEIGQIRHKNEEYIKNLLDTHKIEWSGKFTTTRDNNGILTNIHCVWEDEHTTQNLGTMLVAWDNGGFYYHCTHSHCKNGDKQKHTFDDFLQKIGEKTENKLKTTQSVVLKPPVGVKWEDITEQKFEYIPTGFADLDKDLGGGLQKGGYSILIGKTNDGKSTLCNQLAINLISQNLRVGYYAGETTLGHLKTKILQISPENKNFDNLTLFDKLSPADFTEDFLKQFDVFLVDNYTYIKVKGGAVWETDSVFGNNLAEITRRLNNHVFLIVHAQQSNGLASLDTAAGGQDFYRFAEQVFALQRFSDGRTLEVSNEKLLQIKMKYGDGFKLKFQQHVYTHRNVPSIFVIEKTRHTSVKIPYLLQFSDNVFSTPVENAS